MTAPTVLIIGARSDIGMALAHRYAAAGHTVQLAARSSAELGADAADIALRHGTSASVHELDILEPGSFAAFLESLPVLPELAICVVGLLGDQAAAQTDPEAARLTMRSNYEGPALLTGLIAERMEARGSGTIIGISSVRWRARAGEQLRLRLGQGRLHRFPFGPAQTACRSAAST